MDVVFLASYPACNSECEYDGTVVNTNCFSCYDPSILRNIDPDCIMSYLTSLLCGLSQGSFL